MILRKAQCDYEMKHHGKAPSICSPCLDEPKDKCKFDEFKLGVDRSFLIRAQVFSKEINGLLDQFVFDRGVHGFSIE